MLYKLGIKKKIKKLYIYIYEKLFNIICFIIYYIYNLY